MSREKQDWKGSVRTTGGLIHVYPRYENTQMAEGRRHVPAVDAVLPDGRRVFLTFESENYAGDGMSRDQYISRMRHLADALSKEADRMDKDPCR